MAKTKVYKSNSWEQAGAALNPSAGRSVGNVSVAAGWHSENIVTLDKGKYIIQVQFIKHPAKLNCFAETEIRAFFTLAERNITDPDFTSVLHKC